MVKMVGGFNAKDHEKMGDFTPIPADEYMVIIKKTEQKRTKDEKGAYIAFQFEVINHPVYSKRILFTNLNIENNNPVTVEIAEKQLATIAEAVGVPNFEDTEQLHGIPLMIKVVLKPATPNAAEKNEIKFYSQAEGVEKPNNPAASSGVQQEKKTTKVKFE